MSNVDETGRERREDASSDTPDAGAAPGEIQPDPAYAAGAGFSGEATGATPPEEDVRTPEVGPDPLGSGQPDPTRPEVGGGEADAPRSEPSNSSGAAAGAAAASAMASAPGPSSGTGGSQNTGGAQASSGTASSSNSNPLADTDAKTMALVAHAANIATVVIPPVGTIVALVVAYLKKDTAPDWLKTHFVLAIRTGFISVIVAVGLLVLSAIAVPLLFVGVGFVLFPLIGVAWLLLAVWIVVRSVIGLMKLNENQPYPNPESWLI